MDQGAAEREAVRLWRRLPAQDRLSREQAAAFARMIAPTLDFEPAENRTRLVEGWLLHDLHLTDPLVSLEAESGPRRPRLTVPPWPQREGAAAVALVIALLVLIARRPDIITAATLWADDGATYFADAYNHGWWAPLFIPHDGFLQLFPRLVFGVSTFLPLWLVPVFSVWVALLARAALPAFLFSSRFSWIDWRAKVLLAAYFILMPNIAQAHANITNTHWYLGLYLLAVVLADPPRTIGWKAHDWVALLISGTTGPLVIFVLPVLALRTRMQRSTAAIRLPFLGAAVALAALQLIVFIVSGGFGAGGGEAIDPIAPLQILVAHVLLGFLTPSLWANDLSAPIVVFPTIVIGAIIAIAVAVRGNWRSRGLLLTWALVFAVFAIGSVFSPAPWPQFPAADDNGYFIVACVGWVGTLLYFAAIYLPPLSNATLATVAGLCGALILFNFTLPPVAGPLFGAQVDAIEATAPGQPVTVPIAPPGWDMTLIGR